MITTLLFYGYRYHFWRYQEMHYICVLHTLLCKNYGEKYGHKIQSQWRVSSVQFSHSHVQLFATLWTIARQAFLFITNSPNLFKLMSIDMVGDAIQPSHPLLSPSLPAFNISQHQGLFKWVSSLHQVAKVLDFQLQHQSFQWTLRTDLLSVLASISVLPMNILTDFL